MENQKLTTEDLGVVKNDKEKAEFLFCRGKDLIDFVNENSKHLDNKAYQLIGVLFLALPLIMAFKEKLSVLGGWVYPFGVCYVAVFFVLCWTVLPRGTASAGEPPKNLLDIADQEYSAMVTSYLILVQNACDINLIKTAKKANCLKIALCLLFLSFAFLGVGIFATLNI